MKHIFAKLSLLFVLTALIPVGMSYWFSIYQLQESSRESILNGHYELAKIAAENVDNYFENAFKVIKTLAKQLEELQLTDDQKNHLIKNTFLDYKYFQYIHYYDVDKKLLHTSDLVPIPEMNPGDSDAAISRGEIYISPVYLAKDPPPVRPAMRVVMPVFSMGKPAGFVTSEINLIYMWHLVNQIRPSPQSVVAIINPEGQVVASSNLALLFELQKHPGFEGFKSQLASQDKGFIYAAEHAGDVLMVHVPLSGKWPGYSLLVEQPTSEAFAAVRLLSIKLLLFGLGIVALMVFSGYYGVRWQVLRHLKELMLGIQRIGEGNWKTKVNIASEDEFRILGNALNDMTSQLEVQKKEIRQGERLALLGKISGGLIHDLKHPIQNIRNWIKLLPDEYENPEYREKIQIVIDREFHNVDEFFVKLKSYTTEIHHEPKTIEVGRVVDEVIEGLSKLALERNVTVQKGDIKTGLQIIADRFSLMRILSNIVSNAIQAIPLKGTVHVDVAELEREGKSWLVFSVEDTGLGMTKEQLSNLFGDFATTKRKGLGLGLAITEKMVKKHGGFISVFSEPNRGTRFHVHFPDFKS